MSKQSASWRPLLRLLRALGEHKVLLIGTALAGVLAQVCAVAAACAGAWLVAKAVLGAAPHELVPSIVLLGAGALGAGVGKWLELWLSHVYAFRVIAGLRLQAFDGLERLAPEGLARGRTGNLTATVMSDIERLESIYAHQLPSAMVAMVVPACAVAVLLWLAPVLGLFVGVMAVLLASVPSWLSARAHAQGKLLRAHLGTLHAEVVDGVQGVRELILFGRGDAFLERLRSLGRSVQSAQLSYGRRKGAENAAADIIVALTTVGMLVLAAHELLTGNLPRAMFAVVVILAATALASIVVVVSTSSELGELSGCAARVVSVIDAVPPVIDRPGARTSLRAASRVVRFENVTFGYDGGTEVLSGVDFSVAPGETVALVGKSGAGKTTCVNLLLRFWDPHGGRITIGDVDIRDLTVPALRDLIAVVPQDSYLFHTTLRENIRLARPSASDAEVEAAGRRARLDGLAGLLDSGYDTELAERGQNLSGGQRQRIAIARAVLRGSPVLVLDEAVSQVDVENELLLRQALAELSQGRVTLVVAHRLATIRAADRVVVLDGGRILAEGRHDDLVRTSPRYARIVAADPEGAGTWT